MSVDVSSRGEQRGSAYRLAKDGGGVSDHCGTGCVGREAGTRGIIRRRVPSGLLSSRAGFPSGVRACWTSWCSNPGPAEADAIGADVCGEEQAATGDIAESEGS